MGTSTARRSFGFRGRSAVSILAGLIFVSSALAQTASRPASAPTGARAAGAADTSTTAPAKLKITIGKDTTYIDGPVNADGTVDYLAAFNARQAQGVTPQNNAAIPLLKAVGPTLLVDSVRDRTLKAMGIDVLSETGPYLVPLDGSVKEPNRVTKERDEAIRRIWQAKDYPELAAWLQANEKPLAAIVEATKLPRFDIPAMTDNESSPVPMIGAVLPRLMRVREAARALAARATLRSGQGDVKGARADLMAVHKLARLVAQQKFIISILVGMALDAHAFDAEQAMVGGKIASLEAKALLAELVALPALPRMAVTFDLGERPVGLDATMSLARASLQGREHMARVLGMIDAVQSGQAPPKEPVADTPAPDILDWDVILRAFNQRWDRLVTADSLPTFRARTAAFAALQGDIEKLFQTVRERSRQQADANRSYLDKLLQKGPEGCAQASSEMADLMVGMLFPGLSKASELYDRSAMRLELSKVSLALSAYRAEKGQFPDALSALAPAYMREVPKDLFTEAPLVYKKTAKGFLLYSLGPNMKDDGGKSMEEDPVNFDIPVKVE